MSTKKKIDISFSTYKVGDVEVNLTNDKAIFIEFKNGLIKSFKLFSEVITEKDFGYTNYYIFDDYNGIEMKYNIKDLYDKGCNIYIDREFTDDELNNYKEKKYLDSLSEEELYKYEYNKNKEGYEKFLNSIKERDQKLKKLFEDRKRILKEECEKRGVYIDI